MVKKKSTRYKILTNQRAALKFKPFCWMYCALWLVIYMRYRLMQMINCWWENISLYQCYLKIIKSLLTCSVNEIEIILTPVLHCPNSLASINMPYKDTGQGSKFKLHKKIEFPSKLEKVIFLKKPKCFAMFLLKILVQFFFELKFKSIQIFFFLKDL